MLWGKSVFGIGFRTWFDWKNQRSMHWVNQENYAKKHHVLQLQIMHFFTEAQGRERERERQLAHALIMMLTILRDFVMLTRA